MSTLQAKMLMLYKCVNLFVYTAYKHITYGVVFSGISVVLFPTCLVKYSPDLCEAELCIILPSSAKPQQQPQLPAAAKLAELQPYFAFHPASG